MLRACASSWRSASTFNPAAAFTSQGSALLLGDGLIEFGHVLNNLAGIDGLQHFARLAGFGAGDGQQRIEGLQQAVGFLDGLVQGGAVFGLAVGAQGGFNARPSRVSGVFRSWATLLVTSFMPVIRRSIWSSISLSERASLSSSSPVPENRHAA